MKTATKAIIEKDFAKWFYTNEQGLFILESDLKALTENVLHTYSNVYCLTGLKCGQPVFEIKSSRSHKSFLELPIASTKTDVFK